MRQTVGDLLRNILDIEYGFVRERLGQIGVPCNAREQLDIAHRRDERALILGRKGAVDPIEQVREGNTNVLPAFADHDADRRPRERNQTRGDCSAVGTKTVDKTERTPAATEHENARLVA